MILWTAIAPFLLVALVCCPREGAAVALAASPSEILSSPGRFDGQAVTLKGVVTTVRPRRWRDGYAHYELELTDGKRPITVSAAGRFSCRLGNAVVVDGRFQRVRREGRYTFFNEVEATSVACR
jgi:cytochrome c-type biogenesis protein CcmE